MRSDSIDFNGTENWIRVAIENQINFKNKKSIESDPIDLPTNPLLKCVYAMSWPVSEV